MGIFGKKWGKLMQQYWNSETKGLEIYWNWILQLRNLNCVHSLTRGTDIGIHKQA
jgi:hypothetical protein